VNVRWLRAALLDTAIAPGGFDLVSVHYPALLRTPDHRAEQALFAAVAPGGTLLVVHHADMERATVHGFDPADYVAHEDIVSLLNDGWRIEVDERRPRDMRSGAGGHHVDDLVLKAQRLGALST
jgi:hypothetical protein